MKHQKYDEIDAFLIGLEYLCFIFATCGLVYFCTPKYKPHPSTFIYPLFHKFDYFDQGEYDNSYPLRKNLTSQITYPEKNKIKCQC